MSSEQYRNVPFYYKDSQKKESISKMKLPISTCRTGEGGGTQVRQCEFLGSLGASGEGMRPYKSKDGWCYLKEPVKNRESRKTQPPLLECSIKGIFPKLLRRNLAFQEFCPMDV